MLPDFDPVSGLLPHGEHVATWREIEQRFGWNVERRLILVGFLRVATNLRRAGCKAIYLNGSFVTSKELPKDFDACCDVEGIDHDLVDPLLKQGLDVMRGAFRGEIQPMTWHATPTQSFLNFFQLDTRTNQQKGIVRVDLTSLPTSTLE